MDLDNDGDLDLWVGVFNGPNLLYINDGKGNFREEAGPRGLDYSGASVMTAFGDYDLDGACSQGWCSRLTELETGMAAHPPRSMAGLLLGLKVIRANDMVEWSDLETGIIDAGIRILGKEE